MIRNPKLSKNRFYCAELIQHSLSRRFSPIVILIMLTYMYLVTV